MESSPTRSEKPFPQVVQFGCAVERGVRAAWVQPTGELDLLSSPVLLGHLREALAEARLVVLDLRQLTFIDASGVHVICDASRNAGAEDQLLMVIRGPERVHRVFTLTGVSDTLAIFDIAKREVNLTTLKPALRSRVCMATTDAGRSRIDLTTPAAPHKDNESKPLVSTGSRFYNASQITPERDGVAR